MAVTDQQKLDFLLKKIGYTKTKTGSVVGTGAISGTPKQPFAEAIPSPLIIANGALWNEADSIPATPPGADTTQVKVYLAATSGLRMTADATSSGQRAYIAYSTYGNTSSTRLTNWIDTQFGASYIIKVYKGDPNSGGVNLSAAGSGANDGWFFDYSAGVLNFNDTNVPSGVTDTNIYIVGYRYIGQTGAPTSGISTFSFKDLTVERNLDVGVQGGISTFRNNIDANGIIEGIAGENKIPFLYSNLAALPNAGTYHGMFAHVHSEGRGYFAHAGNWLELVNKDTSGNVGLSGDLDVDGHTNLDNVSVSGITTFSGIVDAVNTPASIRVAQDIQHKGDADTKISFPSADTITFDTAGTQRLNIASNGNISVTNDLDVDGHTNLDNISVAGVSTFTGDATFSGSVSIGGTLTYEDVTNVDSVGLLTARSGIRVTGGVIEALAGENKIPSLYANMAALPSASTYHGMFAHVHSTGRGYFAHGGAWYELVNADLTGRVGTGTESYFIDRLVSTSTTATSLNVTGVTTAVTVDINGDLDVDGHTNLDNVSVVGVATFGGNATFATDGYFTTTTGITIENSQPGIIFSDTTANPDFIIQNRDGSFAIRDITSAANRFFVNMSNGNVTVTGDIDASGDLDVDGHTNLDNVSVAGVTTMSGDLTISNTAPSIYLTDTNHNSDFRILNQNGTFKVYDQTNGADRLEIFSGGTVAIDGNLDANAGLDVTGNATFANDIDVDGHTNLDNVSIAGVTTMSGNLSLESTYPRIYLKDTNHNPDFSILNNDGNLGFRDDTNGEYRLQILGTGETKVYHNLIVDKDLDVDGHTELDNVNISGVTTFAGNIDANSNIDLAGDLDVDGHTNLDNISVAGVTTFAANTRFNSTIAVHDGTTGSNGQYLKSIGTGVTWATFPTLRTRDTIVASAGQTFFSFNYTVNFIDVFVNGIKLTDSEFTATNGTSVTLAVGCFVGDIVEFVSYNTVSAGGGGGGGTLNNIVEDTSPQLGGNLDLFGKTINGTGGINMTGVVTATTFIGDGSGLTGITASGTGVVIRDNDTTVGTAGTINFGDNLSVTPIVAGIVTVGIDTSQFNFNKLNVSGITTFVGVTTHKDDVHFGGTNSEVWFWGNVNPDQNYMAWKSWVAGGSGGLYIPSSNIYFGGSKTQFEPHGAPGGAASHFKIKQYSSASQLNPLRIESDYTYFTGSPGNTGRNIARFEYAEGASLYYTGTKRLQTSGVGVTITSQLDTTNIVASGVVTATTFKGALQATSGSFSSNIDANGDLDVDGHTNLDNVSIAGVVTATTFVGALTGNASGNAATATALQNARTIGGVSFDGTANINLPGVNASGNQDTSGTAAVATRVTVTDQSTDTTCNVLFAQGATGNQLPHTGTNLTFNSSTGQLNATKFVGDGSGLTNVSAAGINTTNLRADTIVVGENTTGVSTFHRVNIPTNKTMFFGNTNQASLSYQTSGYLYMYGGIEGDMVIQTGGNRAIKMEASGNFEIDTGANEIAIKATKNGPVELYQNAYGGSEGLRFATTGVGVTVIGITSMTDNLLVGTAATITPAGAAQFAGIVTANSFVGDGSGLTGITAAGTGVVIKEGGSTVGTAGTINFVGVDVSPASAGIVTVSTATTSITDGNSKLFVNNVSSSNGNGSFEVFLNEFTYGGTRRALNMHQPSDGYARIDLFHGAQPTTVEVNSKTVYSGYARHRLKFETNNASYGGQLDFLPSTGTWNFYSTYQGTQKNLMNLNYNSINVQGTGFYPMSSNATDLGLSSYKWRQFHVTGVNAGVVTATSVDVDDFIDVGSNIQLGNAGVITATSYRGDGSQLTGISGSQNVFQTVAVSGQSNVVADSTTDTLTLVAGSNMTITTNAGSDTITFASSGGSSTPAYTDVQVAYELTNSSSSGNGWRINGNGFANSTGNPDIYLVRGQKYRFINNSGGSHPFQIQSDASTAYSTGVTNNNATSGNIDFIPQNSAPAKLYYNCTNHGGMLGVIYIIGEPGRGTTSAATGSIAQAAYADITIPTTGKTFALLKIAISAPAWVVLYTDTSSRTSDAAGTGSGRSEGTDPTPGSGVLAEVSTTTSGASTFKMTPGVIGWNDDGTPATQIYARVYNKRATSGSNAITVTLTTVNIEA